MKRELYKIKDQNRALFCEFVEARAALGGCWLVGGVSLAEGIRRKTKALEKLSRETREYLSTLVYWHDNDRVDESWWAEARRLTAKSNPSKSSSSCPEPASQCPECGGQGWYVDNGGTPERPEPAQRQCERCGGKGEA